MSDELKEQPFGYGRDFDYNRFVEFLQHTVQPPSAVYLTRDDTLILRLWSPVDTVTVRISLRWQGPDGRVIPQFFTTTQVTTGATPFTLNLNSAEGYLLSAVVENASTTPAASFVSLEIVRGQGTSDQTRGQIILCGNLKATPGLSFPQTKNSSPVDGRGRMRAVNITAPGAGNNLFAQVPAGCTWIMRSVIATFTTSVAVANRTPILKFADSGLNDIALMPVSAVLAASLATSITWAPGLQALVIPGTVADVPMPMEYRLPAGFFILTATTNLQGGDAYTAIFAMVEEFLNS